MLIVGLTGGIASGKSAAAKCFATRTVEIIDTDCIAREVVQPTSAGLRQLVEHFGATILTPAGELDRAQLRRRVFADPTERARLDNILHPLIRTKTIALLEHRRGPYTILVVPLLLESSMTDLVNRILVVDVPVVLQRQRLLKRMETSDEEIECILAAQASRAARLTRADDVIDNSGSLTALDAQVAHLHARYLRLAQHRP
ncbi:dephospho-CoA kinase [Nitrococcus mobilis]|uniref:Dephospho-CoA kinase n=1 Tax=Nitrococcus mobilis Nb-231 TaxID=314278 RepID=A4BQH2_9GAMM|nr:dephospho-CoA kinase [Nitrococcus mobilis]EAR21822.1 Dephospho-CoA kinase [Nitrococcus mobilis Nb-231]